jgi:GT2 family glycosyltransferase
MKFYAFIMTYVRTEYLMSTVNYILSQSMPPQKIIIVDNSESDNIRNLFLEADIPNVFLISTNENLGPAGAAKLGLGLLADDGCDWIYWGDDDDPPTDPKTFERLLEIASENPKAGIIGKGGGEFIPYRARTRGFSNRNLSAVTEADYVTGGKQMIVSAKLVKAGILPSPELFFGFEELDFCLRAKDAGFSVLIDGEGILKARRLSGKVNSGYRWKGQSFGRKDQLNRQYYSLRNLLYILRSRGQWIGYFFLLAKTLAKMIVSLRYGFNYSRRFIKSQFLAIQHEWCGRLGRFEVFS